MHTELTRWHPTLLSSLTKGTFAAEQGHKKENIFLVDT